jgi:YVTN family beta-propeller protein
MYHVSATTGRRRARAVIVALGSLTLLGVCPAGQADPTRSTDIALTDNDTRLVNVNHEADSVTLFDIRGNGRRLRKVAEIPVGEEPYCVAVDPRGGDIFVTNGVDGTVSVISPATLRVIRTIAVGTEPRGCALTPDGERLFVANHTAARSRSSTPAIGASSAPSTSVETPSRSRSPTPAAPGAASGCSSPIFTLGSSRGDPERASIPVRKAS